MFGRFNIWWLEAVVIQNWRMFRPVLIQSISEIWTRIQYQRNSIITGPTVINNSLCFKSRQLIYTVLLVCYHQLRLTHVSVL